MLPYVTERLKGGAIVKWGELPIGETEEGVVIEPEVETQIADKADQLAGAAGVYVLKGGFQIRATLTRFTLQNYAAALGLSANTAVVPGEIDFAWPAYLPAAVLEIVGQRADGTPATWRFPAASVLPSGSVTLGREPSGVPIVWKALVDPARTESFGKMTLGEVPV
jgi:hypothetical protein